jgi:predicted nucleic acid-binding protein
MNSQLTVVVDADAIVARAIATDANNERAFRITEELIRRGAKVIYPSTTVTEAVTALQRKFSNPHLAAAVLEVLTGDNIIIENVTQDHIRKAREIFDPNASKQNTLFDCIVAVIVTELEADAVFGFDDFFPKHQIKLAEDVLWSFQKSAPSESEADDQAA